MSDENWVVVDEVAGSVAPAFDTREAFRPDVVWPTPEALGPALFVNENLGGHATMHLHMFEALAEHPELEVDLLDVPRAGFLGASRPHRSPDWRASISTLPHCATSSSPAGTRDG